jgi:arginine deiminase
MKESNLPIYWSLSETEKPRTILVHEPGLETRLAFEHPQDWGFDPILSQGSRSYEEWLSDAKNEHRGMVEAIRSDGIEVLYLRDLLAGKEDAIVSYLIRQHCITSQKNVLPSSSPTPLVGALITMMENPVDSLLMGLEAYPPFAELDYVNKLNVYKTAGTFMPQTSLYFTQDPVISVPTGLIRPKMSMWMRREEPAIVEIALGKENYIHRMRSITEGGDITLWSQPSMPNWVPYRKKGYIMLASISAASSPGARTELMRIAADAGIRSVAFFYVPDNFDLSLRYSSGNVMHDDTIKMPVSDVHCLGNRAMLEKTIVSDGKRPLENAYQWVMRTFPEGLVEVPDEEQQGIYGWGSNVLPLGGMKVLSSDHLLGTNANLRKAGFDVRTSPTHTLTTGYGSHHCMTAILRSYLH